MAALSLVLFPGKLLVFIPYTIPAFKTANPLILGISLAFLLLYPDLTMVADRLSATLRLEYRYLLFYRVRVIAFDDIKTIKVQKSSSSSNGRSSTNYRIAALLRDGSVVPFRFAYSSESGETRQAARLQAFIFHKPQVESADAAPRTESPPADGVPSSIPSGG